MQQEKKIMTDRGHLQLEQRWYAVAAKRIGFWIG